MNNSNFSAIMAIVGAFILLAIVFGLFLSYPVMLLWNACLVPAIPAIQEVTWLQTWGIMILTSIMFKRTTSKSN